MKQYILVIIALVTLSTSCAKWLTVDSPDRILEDKMFEQTDGFYTSLNGVYIELANPNLYAGTFTASVPDILAQYFDTRIDGHIYGSLGRFTSESKRNAVNQCWNKSYNLLLNINKILAHCELKKNKILSEKDYNLIKGEALALRGLLHFELLRIFAPLPSTAPYADAIPYATSHTPMVYPILSTKDVGDKIIQDMEMSLTLLESYDPVIKDGKCEKDDGGRNIYNYRNQRLNYFAVKALLARVYLYMGSSQNKSMAMKLADQVIDQASVFFPFSTREQANGQASVGTPTLSAEDRILSSDILFAVYSTKRGPDIYEKLFSSSLEIKQILSTTESGYKNLYPEESDIRTHQWQRKKDKLGNDIVSFVKYENMEVAGKNFPYLIPVVRMSEMYLISAECHYEAHEEQIGYNRLNAVRNARETSSKDSQFYKYLSGEYAREFAGEGQLFWYWKRTKATSIPTLFNKNLPDIEMTPDNYIFEIPLSEGGYR